MLEWKLCGDCAVSLLLEFHILSVPGHYFHLQNKDLFLTIKLYRRAFFAFVATFRYILLIIKIAGKGMSWKKDWRPSRFTPTQLRSSCEILAIVTKQIYFVVLTSRNKSFVC